MSQRGEICFLRGALRPTDNVWVKILEFNFLDFSRFGKHMLSNLCFKFWWHHMGAIRFLEAINNIGYLRNYNFKIKNTF